MSCSRRRLHRNEEGQVLILVLVFVVAFGLLISTILGLVTSNLKTTKIVRSRTERAYAADAGIENAIAHLRSNPTACTGQDPLELPSQTLNGHTATVSCEMSSRGDLPLGASGWAAIITGDLIQQGGGTGGLNGPIYVKGKIEGSFKNKDGSVYQYSDPCPGTLTRPDKDDLEITPEPPYSWYCTEKAWENWDPAPVLPAVPGTPKAADTYENCRVFYPGKYTSIPDLLELNYFVSGVYYFENLGSWQVPVDTTITGGSNLADTAPLTSSCRPGADMTPGGGGNGFGVQWIFGGNSHLSFKNRDAFELHSRVPLPSDVGVTPRVSFVAVPTSGDGYLKSDPPAPDTVFNTFGGQPAVAIHGLFYAPTTDAELNGPNGLSVFRGGAVIRNAHLTLSGTPDNDGNTPIFIAGISKTNRWYVVLTATAKSEGEAPVIARALVEFYNPLGTQQVIVRSWRTR